MVMHAHHSLGTLIISPFLAIVNGVSPQMEISEDCTK